MSGLLNLHPLAELIHEINAGRLSGVLRLSCERAKGAIYFEEGQVVNALTNLRAYRLTEALRRQGSVPTDQLDATLKHEMTDAAAGAVLVAAALITPEELRRLRERLSVEVLRQLLQWMDGEWDFDARVRLSESQRAPVEVGQLLIESARRLPAEIAARSFRDADERLSANVDAATGGAANSVQLSPLEGFVLSRCDAPLSLGELLSGSGLPEDATRKAVYVLTLGGFLRRERPTRALPDVTAPAPKRTASTGTQAAANANESPASDAAGKHAAEASAPAATEAGKDTSEELAELFERAEGASHYETLGLGRLAKPDEIKRAYYALAKRFHPDRWRNSEEAERQRVEVAFAKIAQAYETLKDSSQRASYDLKLSTMRAPSGADSAASAGKDQPAAARAADAAPATNQPANAVVPPTRAEELFQAGLAALGQNNFAAATKALGEAVLLAPQQSRYRALFGRLLARDKATRRQAESEFQAAIALDTKNISYRVMLAELYRDVGLRRRAQTELEQALAIDRTNDAARRMLDELGRSG